MRFNIITLFPKMFDGPLSESIISRAKKNNLIDINLVNLRDFAEDKHETVDDTPYGGGPGMVLKVDVVDRALHDTKLKTNNVKRKTILLTPTGKMFNQEKAIELSKFDELTLVCGHYEGFDQRIHDHLVDEEISIGNFVLTGGELPAMVIIDAVTRMIPGAIKDESRENESFMPGNSEHDYKVYTKPAEYKGWEVPEVLKNGNHAEIKKWRNGK